MKTRIQIAISLVWYCGSRAAELGLRLIGRPTRRKLVVLYYHSVPSSAAMNFASQMAMLGRHSRVVEAGCGTGGAGHAVAITFDDAFRSVLEVAVPELVRHRFSATIFVPVAALGRRPGWVERAPEKGAGEHVMTADELRSLPETIELGSHSRTHAHLTTLDDADLRREVVDSRDELAALTGRPVRLFAFPYGECDARVVESCRAGGYELAFSIVPRHRDQAEGGFVRGRIGVEPSDGRLTFFLKMRGAYAWMPAASRLKRALSGRGTQS